MVAARRAERTAAIRAVLTVLPLDTFVERPVLFMEPVSGEPVLPVHREVTALATAAEGREVAAEAVSRFDFYQRASRACAVVATTEQRPYGCFLLVKGVIA